jgi:hypothetical protein
MDISTTKTDKNETTNVHMLVTWRMKYSKPFVYVVLVENTKEFA